MKNFFLFSLIFLVFLGPIGCSLWSHEGDTDESFWEDDQTTAETSSTRKPEDLKAKIQELSKAAHDSEAKITMMQDEVDDVSNRIREEKAAIRAMQSSMGQYRSGKKTSAANAQELERQMRILKNDVEWLKWIEGNQ